MCGLRHPGRADGWGPLAAEHVDRLIAMMHAEGDYMPETVEARGLIGPVHENVVPNIVDKLEVADVNQNAIHHFRLKAFEALARFEPKAAPAVPYLIRFIKNPPPVHSSVAIGDVIGALQALRAIGAEAAKDAIPAVRNLTDPKVVRHEVYAELRREAALTLDVLCGKTPASGSN